MGKLERFFSDALSKADLSTEMIPQSSITELSSNRRIVIERHLGICAYSETKITVNVTFGSICICGRKLSMEFISHACVVITGEIQEIHLNRGRAV